MIAALPERLAGLEVGGVADTECEARLGRVWGLAAGNCLGPRSASTASGAARRTGVAAQACVAEPGRRALARLARPPAGAAREEGVLSTSPRILVVDMAAGNGTALPDGRVLLARGLIEQARSPDEVPGVLAHELGHVIGAHPEQGTVRVLGVSDLARLAALGGPDLLAVEAAVTVRT